MNRMAAILAAAALLSTVSVVAQETEAKPEQPVQSSNESPQMVFAVLEHDFGRLTLDGPAASFEFGFTNTGTAPLVVIRTQTSCSCIKVAFPRKPVPPGGKAFITVTYNPDKDLGTFSKGVHVFTNSPERQQTVFVKGYVAEAP